MKGKEGKGKERETNIEANKVPHEDHAFLGQSGFDHRAFFLSESITVGHVIGLEGFDRESLTV